MNREHEQLLLSVRSFLLVRSRSCFCEGCRSKKSKGNSVHPKPVSEEPAYAAGAPSRCRSNAAPCCRWRSTRRKPTPAESISVGRLIRTWKAVLTPRGTSWEGWGSWPRVRNAGSASATERSASSLRVSVHARACCHARARARDQHIIARTRPDRRYSPFLETGSLREGTHNAPPCPGIRTCITEVDDDALE